MPAIYVLTALLLVTGVATAQNQQELERRLQSDYVGKYWLIRGFYEGGDLHFDNTGKLLKGKPPQSWTLAGVKIARLKLQNNSLEVSGNRVAYVYDSKRHKFSPENWAKVRITLDTPNPPSEAGVRQLLDGVFLSSVSVPPSEVPEQWRDFFAHGEQPNTKPEPGSIIGTLSDGEQIYRPGKDVKAPRPIYTPDPGYSDAARQVGFQGTLALRFVLDKTGHPTNIRVVHPLGFGLDDKAVEAVKTWKFEPAKRNGEPVPVQMDVEITFRM